MKLLSTILFYEIFVFLLFPPPSKLSCLPVITFFSCRPTSHLLHIYQDRQEHALSSSCRHVQFCAQTSCQIPFCFFGLFEVAHAKFKTIFFSLAFVTLPLTNSLTSAASPPLSTIIFSFQHLQMILELHNHQNSANNLGSLVCLLRPCPLHRPPRGGCYCQ